MPKPPLTESTFELDVSGIAGFFGGEEAFAAMSSIHLVRGRRWLGWYNSPGSYFVAKKYGVLARSRIWDGLYPGINVDPTTMLELDGKVGPRYIAAHSGTRLPSTGHLAYLFAQHCQEHHGEVQSISDPKPSDLFLTIVHLEDFKEFEGYPKVPAKSFGAFDPLAIIPIGCSIAACVLSAVFEDWYCFALILLGVLTNGISCVVIGSGVLKVRQPNPSAYSPPGDGILDGYPRVILMKGSEKAVQGITKGKFFLEYESESQYHDIGICAVLLTIQFLGQLFLIPQGTLFGQILFLATLGISWLFNAYLASVDNEALQTRILSEVLLHKPKTSTVRLPKRTSLVVFAALYMGTKDPRSFLDEMIPNDTAVWKLVKETISEAIIKDVDPEDILGEKSQKVAALDNFEKGLFDDMLKQASIGFRGAKEFKFK
ncbi:hypothetical protein CVT26_015587 [Gymnopilus dilepis]|uniref:Uncharacterized protein n=1 Tax=Gymnopilus dilepis TaxID=231916 RepID=A0A409XYV9_9AGAR|nr:hypothetical protein CVT26_015587 [Gymnopilus dilepis]